MSLLKTPNPEPTVLEFVSTFCTCFSVQVIGAHYGLLSEGSIEHYLILSAIIATGLQLIKTRDARERARAK